MSQGTTDLPPSWLALRLGDVVTYGSTEKAEPDDISPETWVLELEDVERDSSRILRRLSFAERQSKSTKNRFAPGDVLYGKLRPYLNKVVYADAPGVCTTEIVPIKPGPALVGRFLFHWLRHPEFLRYVTEVSHGVNMPRLGTDAGAKAPFVLAPLREQQRIADKLDTVLARVDACRDRLARVAPLLKRFRQSVLLSATSGHLTLDWRSQNGAPRSEVGSSIPTTWSTQSVATYAKNFNGARVPISEELRRDRKGSFLYYGASGPIDTIDGYTHDGSFLLVGEDGANLLSRSKPIAFLAHGKIWVNNHAHVLGCESEAALRYLGFVINAMDLAPFVTGSAQPKLTKKNLDQLPVPAPPLDETIEIVRRVETLFAFADRLEARLAQAQTAVDRLTPSLLAKAFRGELVPQNPADEPAAELLKRLAASRAAPAPKARKGRQAQTA